MSDVSFEEEERSTNSGKRFASSVNNKPGITGWFVTHGFAKNESQANIVQILLVLIIIGISAFFWIRSGQRASTVTPAEQNRATEWMKEGRVGAPPASFMPLTAP